MKLTPWLFADFVPGTEIGIHDALYDEALAAGWRKIFPTSQPDGAEGAGIAVALMMRSYLAVTPRPPGNIHARQRLRLESLPRLGEMVHTVVSCADKEIRRGRRYVEFAVRGVGVRGRLLFEGQLTLVWAA